MSNGLLPNIYEFITIVCMAGTTYFTRVCGYLWLKKHTLSPRTEAVLKAAPCCVMISVAAPSFVTTDPAMLSGLLFTLIIAFKLNLAATICAGVAFTALMQQLL